MCPPQHRGLLWPGHLCRCVCTHIWMWIDVCVCDLFILVVFVLGPDTKLMQNSGRTKFKRTSIDRLMNTLVLWVGRRPLTFMAPDYFRTWSQRLEFSFVYLHNSDYRSKYKVFVYTFRHHTLYVSAVQLFQIFGFLVCMGVILAVGNAVWEREVGSLFQSYLPWDPPVDNFLFSAFLSFWSYVIILNTVVPISLYVR